MIYLSLPAAFRSQAETCFQNYRTLALGAPEEDEEPTAEQLQALHVKVAVLNSAPYADLAIWGPFNPKVVRAMKFVAWLPHPDGTYLKEDIPGPANFSAELTSWRFFRIRQTPLSRKQQIRPPQNVFVSDTMAQKI